MEDLVGNQGQVSTFGPKRTECFAHFAGAAATTMTLLDNFGIRSVTQSTTTSGVFTVTLQEKFPAFDPKVTVVGDATVVHDVPITALDAAAGTFTFAHFKSAARGAATAPSTADNGASPAVTFYIKVEGRGPM